MSRRKLCNVLTALAICASASAQRASLFDELVPLYPDSDPGSGAQQLVSATPRGVPVAVHVLVDGLAPDAELRWSCSGAHGYRLIDVPVEQNTGLDGRTEVFKGVENPHVIRRAPFRIFEVLEPVGKEFEVVGTGAHVLRIELDLEADAEVGARELRIELASGEWKQQLSWKLNVSPVVVPPTSAKSPGYTNWFSPTLIAERHGLELWSEPHWQMIGAYADLMVRGRQNTFWMRWIDFARKGEDGGIEDGGIEDGGIEDGGIVVDRARMQRYVELFIARGFTRMEGGHVARRHEDNWSSPRLDLVITGSDVTTKQGRAELVQLLRGGPPDLPEGVSFLQHLTDEPTDVNAESYLALAQQVRELMPGVSIFEATMSVQLVGAVDAWCPQVQKFQAQREFFEERKRAGDQVWVYTCLVPGGPWLNRLLDQEHLRQVYLGWSLVKYDLDGFLHWGLNHYRKDVDPFEQSVVPHGAGPPNFLPAGDSHVVYPGKHGPLSGLRFEAHRIGMEDAELLQLLKTRDPERATAIIDRLLRAFDDYETDVTVYRAARHELLGA